jgi:riboflavin kinase/FMN adenylyltransferase
MNQVPSALPVIRLQVQNNSQGEASFIIQGPPPRPSLGAIGSFDGLHKGHQAVLDQSRTISKREGLPLSLVTFDPHPSEVLTPSRPPFRLMCLEQQIRLASDLGIEQILVLDFDMVMAALSPDIFLQTALKDRFCLKGLVFGFDFRFGAKGAGTPEFLHDWSRTHEFITHELSPQLAPDGQKWSSSLARKALIDGDPYSAMSILGHPFEIRGKVHKGQQLGRQLGFPTLNLDMGRYLVPKHGVYITRTKLNDGRHYTSISNLGIRPTINGQKLSFETHIFDFNEDIYDQIVCVEFLDYLRSEQTFNGLEALKAQITKDCLTAQEFHRRHLPPPLNN